jgi:hypothetical protein
MHFFVSDDTNDRLDQLNVLMTELIFYFENFNKDNLLLLKMNLSKWKSEGFTFSAVADTEPIPLEPAQEINLFKAYSLIGECLLFRKSKEEAVRRQVYTSAGDFKSMELACFDKLQALKLSLPGALPFFRYADSHLYLRAVEHFFLNQFIREKLELEG